MNYHEDRLLDAANTARDQMIRNTKEAAKLQRMLTAFGVDLPAKKIQGIKQLREQLGIDLRAAAIDLGFVACEWAAIQAEN